MAVSNLWGDAWYGGPPKNLDLGAAFLENSMTAATHKIAFAFQVHDRRPRSVRVLCHADRSGPDERN